MYLNSFNGISNFCKVCVCLYVFGEFKEHTKQIISMKVKYL